jgi:hypothetical protein
VLNLVWSLFFAGLAFFTTRRQLVRRSFAHGLLNGYTLESVDEAA